MIIKSSFIECGNNSDCHELRPFCDTTEHVCKGNIIRNFTYSFYWCVPINRDKIFNNLRDFSILL